MDMVQLPGGLIITPYHPLFLSGSWRFPIDVAKPVHYPAQVLHNFVLENGHSLIVNGYPCITLAHGFTHDVLEHSYLGTQRIINDLKRIDGWVNGEVHLSGFTRSPITNLIDGIIPLSTKTTIEKKNN